MKTFDARTVQRWRAWLTENHATEPEIWLIFHKRHTGVRSVDYLDALDEALCVGWIDSLIKRIDGDRYARKFTPRKPGSRWSAINRKRYAELAAAGRVMAAGRARSPERARASAVPPTHPPKVPPHFVRALKKHRGAWAYFRSLAPSHRRQYVMWIHMAKRPATRDRRIAGAIRLLSSKQQLGLK